MSETYAGGLFLMSRIFAALPLLILLFCVFTAQAEPVSLQLIVQDEPVTSDLPLMVVNGSILVPLHVFAEHLGAEVIWDHHDKSATLKLPQHVLAMRVGETEVLVNGQERLMAVAPEITADTMMVPLRFVADLLNIRIVFDAEDMALRLTLPPDLTTAQAGLTDDEQKKPDEESLTADRDEVEVRTEPWALELDPDAEPQLQEISYLGGTRSRVFIDVKEYAGYESVLLTYPDRLVIDLLGVQSREIPDMVIDDTIIQRIRTSRFDDQTMRVVFDLNRSTGYEIHRWHDGGLEIEFNYQITEVGFTRQDSEPHLWFAANEEPPYHVIHLVEPDRLVLDFKNSTLIGGAKEFAVDDPVVRRLRVSQYLPSVTRVVMELDKPLTPLTVMDEGSRYHMGLFEGTPEQAQRHLAALSRPPEEEEPLADQEVEDIVQARAGDSTILRNRVIAIDPGHGGSDPGAIGPQGIFEKDVVLDISLKLGRLLEKAGAQVVYTRRDDTYISVFERPKIAQAARAEVLVSVHANAYLKQVARGTETLYNPANLDNFHLARALQRSLVDAIQLVDRGLVPRTNLALLNGASIPTALVEVAFVNHPEEEQLLISRAFQQRAAEGLFDGLVNYFSQYPTR